MISAAFVRRALVVEIRDEQRAVISALESVVHTRFTSCGHHLPLSVPDADAARDSP